MIGDEHLKYFELLECSIKSLFVFFFFLFINRALFLAENPDFVLNQPNAVYKWLSSNLGIINVATFAPLIISAVFLVIYIYLEIKKPD